MAKMKMTRSGCVSSVYWPQLPISWNVNYYWLTLGNKITSCSAACSAGTLDCSNIGLLFETNLRNLGLNSTVPQYFFEKYIVIKISVTKVTKPITKIATFICEGPIILVYSSFWCSKFWKKNFEDQMIYLLVPLSNGSLYTVWTYQYYVQLPHAVEHTWVLEIVEHLLES